MFGFLTQLLHRLAVFVDKRRAALLVVLSILLFTATTSGLVAMRPPVLVPVIDTVNGWFQSLFSKPLRAVRYLQSPAPSRERLVALELEVARLREAQRENHRLRDMLGYERPQEFSLVPARLVALDLDPVRGLAWIDKGTRHGVREDQAVLASGGLVGLVEYAGASRSRVRLLQNRDGPIGVRDTRSRVLGVMEWNPAASLLELNFIPRQADIAVGDSLVSSGLGGYLETGLPVGRVESVEVEAHSMLMQIRVKPFASFHTLEEVFVYRPVLSDSAVGEGP